MPGYLEFYAGIEMLSENWLDVSLTNQPFLFYLYHGKKKTINFFETKRVCIGTFLMEMHTDYNNYYKEFEPFTPTLYLPVFCVPFQITSMLLWLSEALQIARVCIFRVIIKSRLSALYC